MNTCTSILVVLLLSINTASHASSQYRSSRDLIIHWFSSPSYREVEKTLRLTDQNAHDVILALDTRAFIRKTPEFIVGTEYFFPRMEKFNHSRFQPTGYYVDGLSGRVFYKFSNLYIDRQTSLIEKTMKDKRLPRRAFTDVRVINPPHYEDITGRWKLVSIDGRTTDQNEIYELGVFLFIEGALPKNAGRWEIKDNYLVLDIDETSRILKIIKYSTDTLILNKSYLNSKEARYEFRREKK